MRHLEWCSEVEEHHRSQMGDSRACPGVREWSSRKRRLQERGRIAVWPLRRWADTAQRPGSLLPFQEEGKKWEVSIRRLLLYFLKEVCVKPSVECLYSWWLLYQPVEATVERDWAGRRGDAVMSPATTPDAYCSREIVDYLELWYYFFSPQCKLFFFFKTYRITTYRNVLKILRIQLNAFHTLLWPAPMYLITFILIFVGRGSKSCRTLKQKDTGNTVH